jgi:uracil phosphoribosyltransferase
MAQITEDSILRTRRDEILKSYMNKYYLYLLSGKKENNLFILDPVLMPQGSLLTMAVSLQKRPGIFSLPCEGFMILPHNTHFAQ